LHQVNRRNQWLGAIVRNEAFREHARVRPSLTSTIEAHEGEEDPQMVAMVELADLHTALTRLDDKDRQLLDLRYRQDLTQEAISRRLGIPEGTVKVRLHRARKKLRRAYVLQ
jgi:RNA polymerase sigma-70 factor (ECF subfamily)